MSPITSMEDIKKFVQERNEALLSLDRETILIYHKKWASKKEYNQIKSLSDDQFWHTVHKAITAIPGLPREARLESKKWLSDRGFKSMDSGDL